MLHKLRETVAYHRAKRRLNKVPVAQVQAWADSAFWNMQTYLDEYRKTGYPEALGEVKTSMVGLLAAIDSLVDRHVD